MKTIILNNTNCREYTTEELEAKIFESDVKKLKKIIAQTKKQLKKISWKTEAGKEILLAECEAKKDFANEYGADSLKEVLFGGTSKNAGFKLQNSKGYGYGNL